MGIGNGDGGGIGVTDGHEVEFEIISDVQLVIVSEFIEHNFNDSHQTHDDSDVQLLQDE